MPQPRSPRNAVKKRRSRARERLNNLFHGARLLVPSILTLLSVAVLVALYLRYSAHGRWKHESYLGIGVLVLDYTVPFDDYKEHAGLMWILNHNKVLPSSGQTWNLAKHYLGYDPRDRARPERLDHADLSEIGLVYLADTYGVYRDDLKDPEHHKAHMDMNPLVFGGLNEDDVLRLEGFVKRGGAVMAEFNSFCEPTAAAPRARFEALLGIEWSGWVGRVFADLYDTDDVPYWLPREFARQFPGREMPHTPSLVLVSRTGELQVFAGEDLASVVPRALLSATGRAAFPDVSDETPYYYWFGIMRRNPGTRLYAELRLPALDGLSEFLARIGVPPLVPLFTEAVRAPGTGRRLYLAGDFADIDFDPGPYDQTGAIERRAKTIEPQVNDGSALFFRFYAPIMTRFFRDFVPETRK